MITELKTRFTKEILPKLSQELGKKNIFAVPRVKCVHVNVGAGTWLKAGGKDIQEIAQNIAFITGQKPIITRARKAISNFQVKDRQPVGVTVTLRGKRMYDFLNKLVHVVFPRVRDFRGIPKKFDGHGNFTVGFREHLVFPEIKAEDITRTHGLQITVITTAKNDREAYALLKILGFPFKES